MRDLLLVPDGWPCKLKDCQPGFFVYEDQLCFKTEYGDGDIFCSSGEYFSKDGRQDLIVQPVSYEWREEN